MKPSRQWVRLTTRITEKIARGERFRVWDVHHLLGRPVTICNN